MKILFFYLLFFLSQRIIAQEKISGIVTGEFNKPLANVSITLHKKGQAVIIAFAVSDKEGKFSIQYKAVKGDSLEVKAALLGYGIEKISFITSERIEFNFSLEPKAIELKEVRIKNPPVWQRKDTINYNASEFKQSQDRVIADIISRLPGMEVTPGGQIKYNGKPINKYYIEGLDLLEDKYGLANNNLPADAVEKVQVLENHQPVRVLDSVQFSDRAALNIKLKDNAKLKVIGRAKLGVGLSPLLAEAETTPMLFKKAFQFITTYKYNNTGLDNTREITSQNISDYINAIQNGAVKNDLVAVVSPGPPPLQSKRWLFNNAHVATGNFLVPLSKTYQLRTNLSYVNDFQRQESSLETKFYLPDDTLQIKETNSFKGYLNRLQTDFTLMANQPDYYLKNQLRFQSYWSAETSRLITDREINQRLRNPFFNISNDFSLLKTGKKTIKEFGSYIGFVNMPQQLNILPGLYESLLNNNLPYEAIQQKAILQTVYTDNFISLRMRKSKFGSRYKAGFNLQSQQYRTELFKVVGGGKQSIADTFQNNLHWERWRLYIDNDWSYENHKWRLSLSVPVNYTILNYFDNGLLTSQKKSALLFRPFFSVMYQLNPKWNFTTSLSFNRDFGDISTVSAGYVLKNYRNFSNNNSPFAQYDILAASASVTFRNPLKIIFFNIATNYSNSKSNLLYRQIFNGNLQTLLAQLTDNDAERLTFSGRLSKYFMDIKTSVAINGGYTFGSQEQLQQEKLVQFRNRSYSTGFSLSTKFSSKLSVDYTANYSEYFSKSQLQQRSAEVENANQRVNINYLPAEQIILKVSAEHYYLQNNFSLSSNYFFGGLGMRYRPKKSKTDFEVSFQNIFNNKEFATGSISNNIETVSIIVLRPRQVIFKVGFTF